MNPRRSYPGIAPFRSLILGGSLAAAVALGLSHSATAQELASSIGPNGQAPSAETNGLGPVPEAARPWRAPVGHFQPSPHELPGLATEGISRTQDQIDYDRRLRICRDC